MRVVNAIARGVAAGLQEIPSRGNRKPHKASDRREALSLLRDKSVPVHICERDHTDGRWEDLLNTTTSLLVPQNRILCSRLAEESVWARVLNLGCLDLRMTPFEPCIKESMTSSLRRLKVMAIDFRRWTTFEMRSAKGRKCGEWAKGLRSALWPTFVAWSRWKCGLVASTAQTVHLRTGLRRSYFRTNRKLVVE